MTGRLAFLLVLLPAAAMADLRVEYFDLENGKRLFVGVMRETAQGSDVRLTHRVCRADGSLVAEQDATLDRATRRYGRAITRNLQTGGEERLVIGAREVSMVHLEKPGGSPDENTLERTGLTYAPMALYDVVRARWKRLEAGEPVELDLAIPQAGRLVRFSLKKVRATPERLTLLMEPTSWLFRRFVEPMELDFSTGPNPRILEFRGETFVTGADGKRLPFRVVYTPAQEPLPCAEK